MINKKKAAAFTKNNSTFEKNIMPNSVQYMVDDKGSKKAVLVPLKVWERLNEDHNKLQNKINVLTGIKNSLKEVRETKEKGKKLQTLNDFLSESND